MEFSSIAPSDVAARCGRLRSAFPLNLQGLLVTNLANIRWLTGFTGSNGWLLVTPNVMALVTDGRYGDQATEEIQHAGVDADVLVGSTRSLMVEQLADALQREHVDRLGFEGAHMTFAEHELLSAALAVTLSGTSGIVEALRRTKDHGEIDRMERASDIADAALAQTLQMLTSEPTESQFRDELEFAMRRNGADGPSFDTIVAAGVNASLPHHHPDSTRITEGMTVVIDFGALFDGYHSDMTRTFVLGDPTELQAEVYAVVLAAQQAGVDAVAPLARGRELDQLCRTSITDAGWGAWFNHGTGHGVGLQIHEAPWLTQGYDDTLAAMDVVTVEPGVYRRDFGGVRIEDMVVVTTNGCRPLTKTPKDSPCLPSPPTT